MDGEVPGRRRFAAYVYVASKRELLKSPVLFLHLFYFIRRLSALVEDAEQQFMQSLIGTLSTARREYPNIQRHGVTVPKIALHPKK